MGCSPWGCEESGMTKRLHFHFSLSCIGEGNGNPLQCSCLENPRDRGAWWAAAYGVAQSQTRLKRLSSSSSSSSSIACLSVSFLQQLASPRLVVQRLKRLPAMWETWVLSLGWEDPLEKETATLSSILAWRIPWTEVLGGLQSRGSRKSWTLLKQLSTKETSNSTRRYGIRIKTYSLFSKKITVGSS